MEPVALAGGCAVRTLQEFLSQLKWDQDRMRDRLQEMVRAEHAGPRSIGIIDETSFAKQGDKTPGVQRQWCGSEGKTENCRVLLYAGADKDATDEAKLSAADYADKNEHKALGNAIRTYAHKEPEPPAPEEPKQSLDDMLQGLKDSKDAAVQEIAAPPTEPVKQSKPLSTLNERLKRGGLID